jgi:hypothetical protein
VYQPLPQRACGPVIQCVCYHISAHSAVTVVHRRSLFQFSAFIPHGGLFSVLTSQRLKYSLGREDRGSAPRNIWSASPADKITEQDRHFQLRGRRRYNTEAGDGSAFLSCSLHVDASRRALVFLRKMLSLCLSHASQGPVRCTAGCQTFERLSNGSITPRLQVHVLMMAPQCLQLEWLLLLGLPVSRAAYCLPSDLKRGMRPITTV